MFSSFFFALKYIYIFKILLRVEQTFEVWLAQVWQYKTRQVTLFTEYIDRLAAASTTL